MVVLGTWHLHLDMRRRHHDAATERTAVGSGRGSEVGVAHARRPVLEIISPDPDRDIAESVQLLSTLGWAG